MFEGRISKMFAGPRKSGKWGDITDFSRACWSLLARAQPVIGRRSATDSSRSLWQAR
jgi:hypothetical protein